MFSHILVYVFGIGTGAGLLIANRKSVEKAVNMERNRSHQTIEKLKRENNQIAHERDELLMEREYNRAYCEGRKSPLSDVERFADTLEKRRTMFVSSSETAK